MPELYHFVRVSGNAKTGPISTSMSQSKTCPDACALKAKGCYASTGAVRIHWTRLDKSETGLPWKEFLEEVKTIRNGALFRHNVAGDLPGENNAIDKTKLEELTKALRNKRGFTYSHKPVLDSQAPEAKSNREAIKTAIKGGFTINLSANNLTHADELLKLGIAPVVSVVPSTQLTNCKTPAGNRAVICPASIRDNVTCSVCGLCARANREYVICFPAHGVAAKSVNEIAKGTIAA